MRRSRCGVFVALSIVLTIVASAHGYFIKRLVVDGGLSAPWSVLATCLIVLGAVLLFAHPITERSLRLSPRGAAVLGWPAYLWLGASFYLLVVLGASDLGLALARLAGAHGEYGATRARWVVCVVGAVMAFGFWNAMIYGPRVKRVEVRPKAWPVALDGYRIAQISDIHIGTLLGPGYARRVTQRCNALDADLIAVTGDLVDGSVAHLGERVAPFAALKAKAGVYFVTGNHDHYSGADGWSAKLASFGFQVLRNRRVRVQHGGAAFELAGVEDYSTRRRSGSGLGDLEEALAGWDPAMPLVVLAHDPRTFEEAGSRSIGLQLSGHTHAGQMWPFTWLVRLQTRFVAGLYRRGESQLYVNRGTGFWGPPLRIFAPGEITELVLRSAT